jgi:O-antigen/teichoic acid export membrane protein
VTYLGKPLPPARPGRRRRLRVAIATSLHSATAIGLRQLGGIPIEQAVTIVRTSGALVSSMFVNSLLGFIFWWVAAQGFPPGAVGLAAAAVAALGLISRLAALGIGTALAGELASQPALSTRLLVPGLITAAAIAGALGLAFAGVAPLIVPALSPLASSPIVSLAFAIAVALTATGFVLDQALVGLLRGGLQLLRNLVFAVGKLVLVAAAAALGLAGGLMIVGAWAAGELLSLGVLLAVLPLRRIARSDADWGALRALRRDATSHHVLNLARFTPSLTMPLIVTALFSPEANALFYVAYVLAAAAQPIASSATFTLYAVARRSPEDLSRQIRLTLLLSFAGVVPAVVVLWIAGKPLLGIFGAQYAQEASSILPLLAALALPLIIKDHWIALARIQDRVDRGAFLTTLAAVAEIAGAIIGAVLGGLESLAVGWLLAVAGMAVLQAPAVVKAARPARITKT